MTWLAYVVAACAVLLVIAAVGISDSLRRLADHHERFPPPDAGPEPAEEPVRSWVGQ